MINFSKIWLIIKREYKTRVPNEIISALYFPYSSIDIRLHGLCYFYDRI